MGSLASTLTPVRFADFCWRPIGRSHRYSAALPWRHGDATTNWRAAVNQPDSVAGDPESEALAALDRQDPQAALAVLMAAYGGALYGYCRQITGNSDLAEDVHQMTFVQAYEGFDRFARKSTLRTWLYSIARHRCLDALKIQRRRRQRIEAVEHLPDEADPRSGPDRLQENRDIATALNRCLAKLTPEVRTAVLLRFQEGFSYPEMKTICQERPATLQARVVRALPSLRRCLASRGVGP